jgi:hypothetical protein
MHLNFRSSFTDPLRIPIYIHLQSLNLLLRQAMNLYYMPRTILWPRERFRLNRQYRALASFHRTIILLCIAVAIIYMSVEVSLSGVTSSAVWDGTLERFGVVFEMMTDVVSVARSTVISNDLLICSYWCEHLFARKPRARNRTRRARQWRLHSRVRIQLRNCVHWRTCTSF